MSWLLHFSTFLWTGYWAQLLTKVIVGYLSATAGLLNLSFFCFFVFYDDAVILAEPLEVLLLALMAKHEDAKHLRFKVQVF